MNSLLCLEPISCDVPRVCQKSGNRIKKNIFNPSTKKAKVLLSDYVELEFSSPII